MAKLQQTSPEQLAFKENKKLWKVYINDLRNTAANEPVKEKRAFILQLVADAKKALVAGVPFKKPE